MITCDDFIVNGEVYISESQWRELNSKLSKNEIKKLISDAMAKVAPPYREISFQDASRDFDKLKSFDGLTLLKNGKWFSRRDYKYGYLDRYFDLCNVGNKSSDYFQQTQRWKCDSINSPSPYRTWTQERFRMTLLNSLWTLKVTKVDSSVLRSCISLRKYIASQFKPSIAKGIYQLFEAKSVLDFSSGWGDRLVAFQATDSVAHYTGIDPNTNLRESYSQQLSSFGYTGSVSQVWSPAEDVNLDRTYDLVFTSPPYFNIERYTQDSEQSWKKYKKLDLWLEGFLYPVLCNSWEHLESGGNMAINISDVYSNHTVHHICDRMNDYIGTLPNSRYCGAIGMRMAKRPNSASDKSGVFCEPIWIWNKT